MVAMDLQRAIVNRLGEHWPTEVNDVDCDASFLEPSGFCFGSHIFDSLDIVEMIVLLEVDFNVPLISASDPSKYDSIAKLSAYIDVRADDGLIGQFVQRWT